mmetsp:Transcript_29009/g.91601  ORF Transcript_29009/g.91601 Transcript_29009/m.91601 type:complete len:546 (+) Transcript_29009:93-1730(+)
MIYYTTGFMNIFKTKGSVFPMSTRAALPCAIFSAILRWAINEGYCAFMEADDSIMSQTQAWAGFSVLVGFLIIFRSSQAYSRFWDGCTATHHMRADWFDMASALISFTETSKAPAEKVAKFKHIIIRLVSMMHSCALMDLEEMNNKWGTTSEVKADMYDLLDPLGIDSCSLDTLYASKARVSLIFQWIQLIIVKNMEAGVLSVPPPILSRVYQEFARGMVAFHECVKISDTPFPFPYAQTCELLLILHWCLVPIVVSQWVTQPFWAFIFVFMQVFVLWSLNFLAEEIENPFGTDENAIDGLHMQDEINRHLILLLDPKTLRTPELSDDAVFSVTPKEMDWASRSKSFKEIWEDRGRAPCIVRQATMVPTLSARALRRAASHGLTSEVQSKLCRAPTGSLGGTGSLPSLEEKPSNKKVGNVKPARNDRLRQEAQARASAPSEVGTKLPPSLGGHISFAIPLATSKRDDDPVGTSKVRDRSPPTARDDGRQEGLSSHHPRTSRSPSGHLSSATSSSGSDEEAPSSRQLGIRSNSGRRTQQRGGQQRL